MAPAPWEYKPSAIATFLVIAAASSSISAWAYTKFKLPHLVGYIFVGILCGPFLLNLLSTQDSKSIHMIIHDAMGFTSFIGFSTGSRFYLDGLTGQFHSVLSILSSVHPVPWKSVLLWCQTWL